MDYAASSWNQIKAIMIKRSVLDYWLLINDYFYKYMDITIVLAQVWGILLVILGVATIVNRKTEAAVMEELVQNRGLLWVLGLMTLFVGTTLIVLNDIGVLLILSSGLSLLIAILGWLAVIKGAFILLFPDATVSLYRKCNRSGVFVFCGFVAFVLGLILLYKGFL